MFELRRILIKKFLLSSIQTLVFICIPYLLVKIVFAFFRGNLDELLNSPIYIATLLTGVFGLCLFIYMLAYFNRIKACNASLSDFSNPLIKKLNMSRDDLQNVKVDLIKRNFSLIQETSSKMLFEKRYGIFRKKISISFDYEDGQIALKISNSSFFREYDLELMNFLMFQSIEALFKEKHVKKV